jgi:hypothetical protein
VLYAQFLYKYLQAAHAESLLTKGEIRVGTLYSYRQAELGPAVGDVDEGKSTTTQNASELDVTKPESRSWVASKFFGAGDGRTKVILENISLVVEEEEEDCFIYCTAHHRSSAAMRAFDADACVRINNPACFLDAIHRHLKREGIVATGRVSPCDYSGRDRNERMERIPPALIKDPKYAYQREVRLLMQPTSKRPLSPFQLSIPELANMCTLYSV